MPAALSCEFIDSARLDSKEFSDLLFGHNVLSDGINIFDGEQRGPAAIGSAGKTDF
jgi:hypothetical protein